MARTPGPWLVNAASAWVEVPDADAPICAMLWPTDLRSEEETFANARLIAGAPDMLDALQEIADINPASVSDDDTFALIHSFLKARATALAALAKVVAQ